MIYKNIVCCLCVRNCEQYLPNIFQNLYYLSYEFKNFNVIFIYDNCNDNSSKLIEEFKHQTAFNVIIYNYSNNNSPFRTVRVSNARNKALEIMYNQIKDVDFHFMIDADEKNIHKWNIPLIKKYLNLKTWDALSFNREDYYDIWALLFNDYTHHCWGYAHPDVWYVVNSMQSDIKSILNNLKDDELFECFSAFNGFAIYRTKVFENIKYNGLYSELKLLNSDEDRNKALIFVKNKLNLNLKIEESCYEVCEHLYFHLMAIKQNNARIKISKFII